MDKVFVYNLTLFTIQEIEPDKISPKGSAIKGFQVFPKWSATREDAKIKVLEALDKELERRMEGIRKLEEIKSKMI